MTGCRRFIIQRCLDESLRQTLPLEGIVDDGVGELAGGCGIGVLGEARLFPINSDNETGLIGLVRN